MAERSPVKSAELRRALIPAAAASGATVIGPAELLPGDIAIEVAGAVVAGFRLTGLHDALDRLVSQVEREVGAPIESLDREAKRAVVHRLDELGAFALRKAVEDIADRLAVSRFTVYNYLKS